MHQAFKNERKNSIGLNPHLHVCLTIVIPQLPHAVKFSMLDMKSMSTEIWKPYQKGKHKQRNQDFE